MSADERSRAAQRAQQEQLEADLVSNRIGELYEKPISGKFDAAYLQAIHGHILMSIPKYELTLAEPLASRNAFAETENYQETRTLPRGSTD